MIFRRRSGSRISRMRIILTSRTSFLRGLSPGAPLRESRAYQLCLQRPRRLAAALRVAFREIVCGVIAPQRVKIDPLRRSSLHPISRNATRTLQTELIRSKMQFTAKSRRTRRRLALSRWSPAMSQKAPECPIPARKVFGTSDGADFGIRVFERIFHLDKWTSRGRSWLAKRENFATTITEKRRSSYIYVRRVKVLVGFLGIRFFLDVLSERPLEITELDRK
jgi:hypothetical protein